MRERTPLRGVYAGRGNTATAATVVPVSLHPNSLLLFNGEEFQPDE